ncbi:hypothetical protein N1495_08785 [Streptococcus didelphis]|uniref:Uncharacterized protein n=1 Tax=Streptococcus didelphis TaxID=102886 RepID=A0ABY9LIM1_9STRE|nr:hypothetical protein [Streptococcus didelphis]WMB28732.1 hypothetical protein N1496_04545 [Streptococcus didelphis]WMB29388.1 hypothetical protein N1495_08785 [Streptococcus didelphis]
MCKTIVYDDTIISKSQVISKLSSYLDVESIALSRPTADELVVNLYEEFDI